MELPFTEMEKTTEKAGGKGKQRFVFRNVNFEMPTRHLTGDTAEIQESGILGRSLG